MKQIAFLLILVSSVLVSSCSKFLENSVDVINKQNTQEINDYLSSKNLQMLSTASGIRYAVNQPTLGRNVATGDEVTLHYTIYLLNGSKVDSTSRVNNAPIKLIFGGTQIIPGFLEAINTLKEGERGTFLIPSILAFGSQSSTTIPSNSVLRLDLEILKLRSEDQQIDEYVAGTKLPVTEKTASGLRIIKLIDKPNGTALKAGLLATVKYTGYLASNIAQFDTGQIDVALGDGAVVKGFEEAILKLKVGEKATVVFPSAIGYGTTGSGTKIPPYSPLIFTIEIISAK